MPPRSRNQHPKLAIIIPVLNEADTIVDLAVHLKPFILKGHDVLLVDGGSHDDTLAASQAAQLRCISSSPGRALQMNAGADATSADYLMFLHADTRLPPNADTLILAALTQKTLAWGRFDVHITGQSRLLPIVAFMMNWRSRLTRIATGDQALFMTRNIFALVGGFPAQPLMEDIEITKQLNQLSAPYCLTSKVTTSGRRWDNHGSWQTILLMWKLRWLYSRGKSAESLAEMYR